MSAVAEAAPDGATPKKGKKKLIIIIAAVLLLAGGGGGGAWFMMKHKAAAAAADAEDYEEDAPVKHANTGPPLYVPLDPFVVNLADRDAERFAQIGVTLQVDDAKFADQMKVFMPAIRNGILMTLAHKTSEQLLQRSGKVELATEIMREAVRPMGIVIDDDEADADEDEAPKPGKKQKKKKAKKKVHNPVTSVHFSSFIIQ